MVVRVAIEDVLVVVRTVRHHLDEHAVLLEEVSCLQPTRFCKLAVIGTCRVKIGVGLCALLETSEDNDLTLGDLKGSHVKHGLGHAKFE